MSPGDAVLLLVPAYLAFLAAAAAYARAGRADREARPSAWPGWRRLGRRLAATAAAGYGVFLAVVALFGWGALGDPSALPHALVGGGLLAGAALPGFLLLTWGERGLTRVLGRRRRRRKSD